MTKAYFSIVLGLLIAASTYALAKKAAVSPRAGNNAASTPAPSPAPADTAVESSSPNPDESSPQVRPSDVDWRSHGGVTPVKNEGQCHASWAFAVTGALEGLSFLRNGTLLDLSEQQLIDCDRYFNSGCSHGNPELAFKYTAVKGIEKESQYPYTAREGTCKYQQADATFKNTTFVRVAPDNEVALAAAVDQEPVVAWVDASRPVFKNYAGGVITAADCGSYPNQAVLIVGYTSTYWIVKNSWGTSWGASGYVYIAKSGSTHTWGTCGIARYASYPQ